MKGQFQVERGSCATTPESYEATPGIEPNGPRQAWQFVEEFQRLLGEDSEPDIRFFVDSWTAGTAAAVDSFQQRRQREPEREHPRDSFCESDSLDTVSFVQEKALYAEFSASSPVQANAKCSNAGWPSQSSEEPAARAQEQAWQEWERFAEEHDDGSGTIHPMTQQLARRLLGVATTSTRKQIKAAYRKMVSQWHPDRLERRTEEVRHLATERMAAINEAYHLVIRALR